MGSLSASNVMTVCTHHHRQRSLQATASRRGTTKAGRDIFGIVRPITCQSTDVMPPST